MSDAHDTHGEHGGHDGGHELENMNAGALFKLLIGLGLVVIVSCVAVLQWVYAQQRDLAQEHADQGSFRLDEYHAEMDEAKAGLADAAAKVAANSADLNAFPDPGNGQFVDPDANPAGK